MGNLLKAFFFKLKSDLAFRITLLVGVGLAIFMTALFGIIDYLALKTADPGDAVIRFCTGQCLFAFSLVPTSNYGLAIPINLMTFVVMEFTHGTIRNKIIAGNSKFKVYLGLFIGGIIFSFFLIGVYSLICLGLGSIIGGFDFNGAMLAGMSFGLGTPEFFVKYLIVAIFVYIFIAAMSVFFATLFRNVGPALPCVLITIFALYFVSSFLAGINETFEAVLRFVNPLHSLSYITTSSTGHFEMPTLAFVGAIVSNSVFVILFFTLGAVIFKKSDVK